MKSSDRTPLAIRLLMWLLRPFPNFDVPFAAGLRQKTVDTLQLKAGDRVLDAGCGTGCTLPCLVRAVGPSGEIVGLEISSMTADNAQKRIAANAWKNVRVAQANAATVKLAAKFDALAMIAAQDVYGSPEILKNLAAQLKDGARVAIFGGKLSHHFAVRRFNPLYRWIFARCSFYSAPPLSFRPWEPLERMCSDFEIREYCLGFMFIASGTIRPARSAPSDAAHGG